MHGGRGEVIWGLRKGQSKKKTATRVYVVLVAENQNVGELLYGKNVPYEELTRLTTEYPLYTSWDLDRRSTPVRHRRFGMY